MAHGRYGTGHHGTGRDVPVNSDAGRKNHSITDRDVVPDSYLAADHAESPYGGAAGYPHLGGNDRALADGNVVSHLDEVVKLGAPADARDTGESTIHSAQCPYLNVVSNLDGAAVELLQVGHPPLLRLVRDIAESVRAEHGAGVDNDPAPDGNSGVHGHMREKACILTHMHIIADNDVRADDRPITERHPFAQYGKGPDGYILAQAAPGSYLGPGGDSGLRLGVRIENGREAGKGCLGIGGYDIGACLRGRGREVR